ncbi:hypothetical protein Vspart_04243 [Vibrio spartinae]|uniref:Uncharacterized protein n=1 Tax=Vibrio spartinae TaxID=1918945 RepID=A0A1N6LZK1_9VIBR|nr:hypothetical protein Vspart_04243 [Vibrio spartinae]SIO92623.1 hypothetical protein VSP9026_00237 [Vibrio spartinae]
MVKLGLDHLCVTAAFASEPRHVRAAEYFMIDEPSTLNLRYYVQLTQ